MKAFIPKTYKILITYILTLPCEECLNYHPQMMACSFSKEASPSPLVKMSANWSVVPTYRRCRQPSGLDCLLYTWDQKWWYLTAMCLVRGLSLGALANSRHPALSSKQLQIVECKSIRLPYKSVVKYTKAREAQHGLELESSRQWWNWLTENCEYIFLCYFC